MPDWSMNRRPLIGILSVMLLAVGILPWAMSMGSDAMLGLSAACIRVGVLLATVYLAYPDLKGIPSWLFTLLLVSLCAVMWRPRLAVVIVPIVLAIWVLRPRKSV